MEHELQLVTVRVVADPLCFRAYQQDFAGCAQDFQTLFGRVRGCVCVVVMQNELEMRGVKNHSFHGHIKVLTDISVDIFVRAFDEVRGC